MRGTPTFPEARLAYCQASAFRTERKASRRRNSAWEDAHEVLLVPGFVLQMPAHQVDHVVEKGFVGVGGVYREEFEQGQGVVVGMTLAQFLLGVGEGNGRRNGMLSGRGRRGLHGEV